MDISPQSNPGEEYQPAGRDAKINSQKGFSLKAKKRKKTDVTGVLGPRIIRSAGRKDRHSKVCTARGTRDRRVRLAPNTAIQFYDVQDRLGYDRPSKAIDWLMSEAKAAIDALDLPPPPAAANSDSLNCTYAFADSQRPENFGFFTNSSEVQIYSEFPDSFEWNYGNSPPPQVLGHNEIQSSPREPLQSSFSRFSNCNPTGIEYRSEDFTAGDNQEIDKIQFSSASFLHYEE